jgi:predicted O-linked N-acetylglucosamine transferase (SPINDLY family)
MTDSRNSNEDLQWAFRLHEAGDLDGAAETYRHVLGGDPAHTEAAYMLARIELDREDHGAAAEHFTVAVTGLEAPEEAQLGLAVALRRLTADAGEAAAGRLAVLAGESDAVEAAVRLAHVLELAGFRDAEKHAIDLALARHPGEQVLLRLRGSILLHKGTLGDAAESCRLALEAGPDDVESLILMGSTFLFCDAHGWALGPGERAVELARDGEPGLRRAAFVLLGEAYRGLGDAEAELRVCRSLVEIDPNDPKGWSALIGALWMNSRYHEALAALEDAVARVPDDLEIRWLHCMYSLLPMYRTEDELERHRALYTERLGDLARRIHAADPDSLKAVERCVGNLKPFLLPYQYKNDRDIQRVYGEMVCHVMASCHPEVAARRRSEDRGDGRITVAFVSEFVWAHSNWKLRRRWMKYLDKRKFRLACVHLGDRWDEISDEIKSHCEEFAHTPSDFDGALRYLLHLQPDVIVFPEIGMSGLVLRIAALRLAPAQSYSYGHPETTGLSTMDYCLTSAVMEPDDGDQDKCLYLCAQTPQKYLPQDDDIYPRIATGNSDAAFVFIEGVQIFDMEILRARLGQAFEAHGLDATAYCHFVPRMSPERYKALNRLVDVFLDSLGWSGCNTTLEALQHGLPIVTAPGRLMRSRHGAGVLAAVGVEDTIARDKDEYVEFAVRLGREPDWRAAVRAKLLERKGKLEEDRSSIDALGEFFERAVARAKRR